MTAQTYLSHADLQGKSSDELQEMLFQEKGVNWNEMPVSFKRGRIIERIALTKDVEFNDKRTGETRRQENVLRHEWRVVEPPIFSQERDWLLSRIPAME